MSHEGTNDLMTLPEQSHHLIFSHISTTPDPSSESSLESLHPWVRAHHKASGGESFSAAEGQ